MGQRDLISERFMILQSCPKNNVIKTDKVNLSWSNPTYSARMVSAKQVGRGLGTVNAAGIKVGSLAESAIFHTFPLSSADNSFAFERSPKFCNNR